MCTSVIHAQVMDTMTCAWMTEVHIAVQQLQQMIESAPRAKSRSSTTHAPPGNAHTCCQEECAPTHPLASCTMTGVTVTMCRLQLLVQRATTYPPARLPTYPPTQPPTVIALIGMDKVTGHATRRFAMMTMYCKQAPYKHRSCWCWSAGVTPCDRLPAVAWTLGGGESSIARSATKTSHLIAVFSCFQWQLKPHTTCPGRLNPLTLRLEP